MSRIYIALIAILVASFAVPLSAQDDDGLTWIDDYGKALRIAKQTHKPLFVEYRCEP
jgi:hypothetical protein